KDSPDPQAAQRTAVTRQVGYDFFKVFNVPLLAGRVFDRAHSEDVPSQPPRPGVQVGGPGVGNSAGGAPPGGAASGARGSGAPPPPKTIVADRSFITALGFTTPDDAIDKLVYAPTPQIPGAQPQPPMRIIGVVEDRSFSFFKLPNNTIGAIYV